MTATMTYDRITAGPATFTDEAAGEEQTGPDRAAERHHRLLRRRELTRESLLLASADALRGHARGVFSHVVTRLTASVTHVPHSPLDAAFRARFPILARRVYVNSCSQGALSLDVEAAFSAFTDRGTRAARPGIAGSAKSSGCARLFAAAIGADADEIAVMPSASAAIGRHRDGARASTARARKWCSATSSFRPRRTCGWPSSGAAHRSCGPARTATPCPLDAYAAPIDERTLIVPVTHVCFRNGYRARHPARWCGCATSAARSACSTTTSAPAAARSTCTSWASTSW